ncbi:MAG: DUF433 domain-containing protein [Thermomicrobiales bacterium]
MATVVGMLADGMTETAVLQTLPDLEPDNVREALWFAADVVGDTMSAASVRGGRGGNRGDF